MKRIIATLLAMVLLLSCLAGCNTNQPVDTKPAETKGTEAPPAETTAPVIENFNETGYPIVNEPITLKIMVAIGDNHTYGDLKGSENSYAFQMMEEQTGIKTEVELVRKSDWDTKFTTMLASEEWPDIILASQVTINQEEYGVTQDVFLPLDDLIEKYMPTYTSRIAAEKIDPTMALKASDGQTYAIGNLWAQDIWTRSHFFLNHTWLEKVGKEVPTNIEELTEVFRAFKTQDPNGNGEADEIPMTAELAASDMSFRYLFDLFGIPLDNTPKWIYLDDNKEVKFAPTQEGFRDCLEWLSLCYNEGLMDIEFLTQDTSMIQAKQKEDVLGFFTNWRLTGMGYTDSPTEKNCKLYIPGADASLARYIEVAKPVAYVTSKNQNVEATMRFLDCWLETENMFTHYWGRELESEDEEAIGWIQKEDGKYYLVKNVEAPPEGRNDCLTANALFFGPAEYIKTVYEPNAQRVEKTTFCTEYENAGVIQKYSNDYFNMVKVDAAKSSELLLLETDIDNTVMEHVATFVKSGVTDDSWNAFVKIFEDLKVADYVKLYQDGINNLDI